jgi:MFS family permease
MPRPKSAATTRACRRSASRSGSLLPDEDFLAWGWRIAFIASVLLVAVGLYIRLKIMETPEFMKVKATQTESKLPFADLIKGYPRNILLGMGARYIDGVFFNVFAVFSIVYLSKYVMMPRTTALWLVTAAAFVMIGSIPIFGKLSDRWGRPKTYGIGALLLAIITYPAFWMMGTGDPLLAGLALVVPLGIVYAICYGPEAALFSDLFESRVRYTGISFVYQFSGIFASGITPIIATYLITKNEGNPTLLAGYVVFAALVSMLSAFAIKRPS